VLLWAAKASFVGAKIVQYIGQPDAGRRILVAIVNSAVKGGYLGEQLEAADDPPHLLVADECHRYTGETFSNVFTYPRTASLGLSATPLSTGDGEPSEEDELLVDELGPVYYDLTYSEGLRRGLIPRFTIKYVGFDLNPSERHTYDSLSRKISSAISDIETRYADRPDSLRCH
jgi:superfamily II DNA or RNA helicase